LEGRAVYIIVFRQRKYEILYLVLFM